MSLLSLHPLSMGFLILYIPSNIGYSSFHNLHPPESHSIYNVLDCSELPNNLVKKTLLGHLFKPVTQDKDCSNACAF